MSFTSGHTPGDWSVEFADSGPVKIVSMEGTICHLPDSRNGGLEISREKITQSIANAFLVAAAPDMLEALKLAKISLEASGHSSIGGSLFLVNQALTRARGES